MKEVNGGMVAEEVRIPQMSRLHCFSRSALSKSSWMGGVKEELCNDGGVWEVFFATEELAAAEV